MLTAIFVCSLSIQAATARLLFARVVTACCPTRRFFGKVNKSTKTPVRAAVFVALFCVAVLLYQDQVARVIAWATVGVYIVYQMVVVAYMYARTKGWPKEKAHFNLGKLGWPISIIALAYGVFMIINLSWPRTPGSPWYDNYLVSVSLLLILAVGLVVFYAFKAAGRDLSGGIHDIETVQQDRRRAHRRACGRRHGRRRRRRSGEPLRRRRHAACRGRGPETRSSSQH